MEHGLQIPHLREIVVFLVTAAILVPTFQRLRITPILGFLFFGILLGPYGFGLFVDRLGILRHAVIYDVEGVRALAEMGIVFLLFTIGLELSWPRLWSLRRLVFGLGAAQVAVTGIAIGVTAWLWGNSMQASILLGASLALSSTAIVMQALIERDQFTTRAGRASFAILLLQDLAVIPILFLITVFAAGAGNAAQASLRDTTLPALAAIAGIVIVGRFALKPLFRIAAMGHCRELFTAMTLLTIIGTAAITAAAGLSMALGAFLAGLILAETEFRHQIEIEIAPIKGLLLGLFFMSVGMGIDVRVLAEHGFWLAIAVIGLFLLKTVLTTLLCRLYRLPWPVAAQTGLSLAQGGEFAFVVIGMAMALSIMPRDVGQFMLILVSLTMVAAPGMVWLGERVARRLADREDGPPPGPTGADLDNLEGHVVIAGYGRVGREVSHILQTMQVQYVALDTNGPAIARYRARGEPVFYGDASRFDMLEKVGANRAAALLVSMNDPTASARTVRAARAACPSLPIYVRAHDRSHLAELRALGATEVIPETTESSLQLAGQLICALGVPNEAVNQLIQQIRERDYADMEPAGKPPPGREEAYRPRE